MRFFLFLAIAFIPAGTAGARRLKPEPPICGVARAKPGYTHALKVSPALEAKVNAYRRAWVEFCDEEPGAAGTLHNLILEAEKLEDAFRPVVAHAAARRKKLGRGTPDREKLSDALDNALAYRLPAFITGFEGRFGEETYFRLSIERFRSAARLGDKVDRRFFKVTHKLRGPSALMPWYRMTWDYGGCVRFGEYDWIGVLEDLREFREEFTRPAYAKELRRIESMLLAFLTQARKPYPKDLCTCGDTGQVIADLEEVLRYFKSRKGFKKRANALNRYMGRIDTERVHILSEKNGSCSGG